MARIAHNPPPVAGLNDTIQIHRIPVGGVSNAYLIESEKGMVLIDTGPPLFEQKVLDKLTELGRDDLRLIFITHSHIDHYGGAPLISVETGAPVAVHHADADALAKGETRLGSIGFIPRRLTDPVLPRLEQWAQIRPTKADIELNDGDRLDDYGLDAYLIHLPGHTPGSSGLMIGNELAIVGDLVSTTGNPHIQRSYADNWAQIVESVKRLQALNPSHVYVGHGSEPMTAEELESLVD